tara:strand:- start:745 stop:1110 length:366 start_codon:yes stop_codon:yes gene_type:complete
MNYKQEVKDITAEINWTLKFGTKEVEIVEIKVDIDWEDLPFEEGTPETTSCSILSEKLSTTPPHYHPYKNERITVKQGSLRISTPTYTKILNEGDIHIVEKGVHHICDFLEVTLTERYWYK